MRKLHLVSALIWVFPGVPLAWVITYLLPEPHALFAVLLVSLWANFYTGIAAWQAAKGAQQ